MMVAITSSAKSAVFHLEADIAYTVDGNLIWQASWEDLQEGP